MTVKERISEFQRQKGYSDFAFERAMGKSRGAWRKTENPSADFLSLIFTTFPDLSAEYVFRGEGDMLRTVPTVVAKVPKSLSGNSEPYYLEVIKLKNERIDQLEDELIKLRLKCDHENQ